MCFIPCGDQQAAGADCKALILLSCLLCPLALKQGQKESWTVSPSWGSQLSDRALPSFVRWFPNIFCKDEGGHGFFSRSCSEMSCWAQALASSGRQSIAAGSARVQLPGAYEMCRDCWGQRFHGNRSQGGERKDIEADLIAQGSFVTRILPSEEEECGHCCPKSQTRLIQSCKDWRGLLHGTTLGIKLCVCREPRACTEAAFWTMR